jgi:plastocyanin
MATSSVLLDPVGWQTGTAGAPPRFSGSSLNEEVRPVRRAHSILVLVAVLAALETGCAGGDGGEGGAAAAPATTAAASGTTEATEPAGSRGNADADTDDVRVVDFAFDPGTVKARVGQKVKWEHQDAGVTHSVVALDGGFRSGELEEGDEFSHLFQRAGTFAYRCGIHPDMRGVVKVSG